MIQKYSKYEFNGIKFEVNYSKESTPCKTIKVTIGDKTAEINNSDFFALLVLYSNEEQIADCVDVKPFKYITKMIKVKAKKDFKKGDDIVFPINYEVTPEVADAYYKQQEEKVMLAEKAKGMVNNIFKK